MLLQFFKELNIFDKMIKKVSTKIIFENYFLLIDIIALKLVKSIR